MFEDQEINPADLAAQLDKAANGSTDPFSIENALNLSKEQGALPIGALALAMQLYSREGKTLGPKEGYFALVFGGELSSVYPEVLDIWVDCADYVKEPVCQARLHDLCFELRRGDVGQHIRSACEAYLAMAEVSPYALDEGSLHRGSAVITRVHNLCRTHSLARRSKMNDLEARAVEAMLRAAQESFDSGSHEPGAVLGSLSPLIDTCPDIRVDELLETARTLFDKDPHSTAETILFQVRRAADDAIKEALRRQQVRTFIEFAMTVTGVLRQAHLETAIGLGRDLGFTDLVDEATSRLQEIDIEDLGLQKFQQSISIDRQEVEGFLAQFTAQPGWIEGLIQLLAAGPPSGRLSDNEAGVTEARAAAPFVASIPKKRIGGDGLPRWIATTDKERDEWDLAEQESLRLQFWAPIYDEALRRIGEKWQPASTDLEVLIGSQPHVRPAVASSLARAMTHYFDGDYEAAAYIALPRIEGLVRDLVLALNLPVYRTQRQSSPGVYPGLGTLVPELRSAGMDPSWSRYVTTLLSSPSGWNVRNEALHGFLEEVGSPAAALILIAALYLSLGMTLTTAAQPEPS